MEWPEVWLRHGELKRQRDASRGRAVDTTGLRRVDRFVRGQQELCNGNNPKWEYCATDDEVYHGQ